MVIHTTTPNYTVVNITVTVEAIPGANTADVEEAVRKELDRRLKPGTWDGWNNISGLDIATWVDDVPGVGKTSIAVALGKVLGLNYNRIQFTPDVLPSDIVGFSKPSTGIENFLPS